MSTEFDPILHDFDVDILSETPQQRLYGKAGNLFFHFILVEKIVEGVIKP